MEPTEMNPKTPPKNQRAYERDAEAAKTMGAAMIIQMAAAMKRMVAKIAGVSKLRFR